MNQIQQRLFICSFDERIEFHSHRISHLVTVANPSADSYRPSWFHGHHLELRFGDVISELDARRYRTTAPNINNIQRALNFFREAWSSKDSKILVSCDYGASRSPALAYIFVADQLGVGHELEAFNLILDICPEAVPNGLVVRLGDAVLKRSGALFAPLKDLYDKITAELLNSKV